MTIATLSTSVQQCINNFAAALIRNKTLILQCIGFTFLWGLIAHGFMFANNNLSWDSLGQMIEGFYPNSGKVAIGRIFVPIYEFLTRGLVTIPWLIGVLSLLYIGIALIFIAKIFNLRSALSLFLIAGVLTVNPTVTSIASTYISDLDADMLAMLLSVLSVYCWQKMRRGYLWGAIPLMFALGLYQSYISTTIVLIIFVCVLELLKGVTSKDILQKGFSAIGMILIAGGLYFCAMKLTHAIFNIQLASGAYNSVDAGLSMTPAQVLEAIVDSYWTAVYGIFFLPSVYRGRVISIMHGILLLCPVLVIIKQLCSKNTNVGQKILVVLLLAITPLSMNICQVLTGNFSHHLMYYAFWLIYLFVLIVLQLNEELQTITNFTFARWSKIISITALCILLVWQVRLANLVYFVKDVEDKAVSSLYTRVINDIEEVPEYVLGETKIAFIGQPTHLIDNHDEEYNRARALTGPWAATATTHSDLYITDYLMYPATFIGRKETNVLAQTEAVASMPYYPAEGSIQMIDNILVVKLGEVEVQP